MSKMDDFLSFRLMITPVIIQILFWVGVILSFLIGGLFLFSSLSAGESALLGTWYSLAIMLGGPVVARVCAELLIVFFRINESVTAIRNDARRLDEK